MAFNMKKYLKENKVLVEMTNEEDYFWQNIFPKLRGKRVGIWTFEPEDMMGSIGLHSKEYPNVAVYATPYWEGKPGIPVQIYSLDPKIKDMYNAHYDYKFSGDPRKDLENYTRAVLRIITGSWFKRAVDKIRDQEK
jgi:hypothetical protein